MGNEPSLDESAELKRLYADLSHASKKGHRYLTDVRHDFGSFFEG
jgi:hypothetical protein